MVVYHSAWDLSELGFVQTDIRASVPWSSFARAIAASFLVLSGIGLVLAHGRGVRPGPFLRRTALLAAAAGLVTLATWFVFPESYIFFGILHNILLSSILALPFVRAPPAVTAAVAASILLAPLALGGPAFDAGSLAFLGLGAEVPDTNDYVPVCPWTGFVLAGVAAARFASSRLAAREPGRDPGRAPGRAGRALAWAGRKSLAIYLLHQPAIFGSLLALRQLLGPDTAAEAAPFMRSCISACRAADRLGEACEASCACTVEELKRDGLWTVVLSGRPSAEELSRASALGQMCLRRGR